jgi:hypothetical protein
VRDPEKYSWNRSSPEVSLRIPRERRPLTGIAIAVVLGVAFWLGLWWALA